MTAPASLPARDRRIPELDGLRGLAIGLVIVFHYLYLTTDALTSPVLSRVRAALATTWSGVDLFFVLSGFLIGGILFDARFSRNYFRVFYTRRFFRIVPVYAAVLILLPCALLLAARLTRRDFSWLTADALPWYAYWTFAQNFWMSFSLDLGANPLKVTWSLAIEEQFYLTLPVLIRIFTGARIRLLVILGVCAAPLLRVGLGLVSPHNWVARFVLMPCRADALLLGVLAAIALREEYWRQKLQRLSRRLDFLLSALLLGVVALTIWSPSVGGPVTQSLGYSWLAFFYAILLVHALTRPSSVISRALRARWLRWLGSIAYGAYLLHQAIHGLLFALIWNSAPQVKSVPTFLTSVLSITLTLAIARLSWRYFESPLLKLGHRSRYEFAEPSPDPLPARVASA